MALRLRYDGDQERLAQVERELKKERGGPMALVTFCLLPPRLVSPCVGCSSRPWCDCVSDARAWSALHDLHVGFQSRLCLHLFSNFTLIRQQDVCCLLLAT